MSDIKRVYSQPNASSLKEGEEVVYLGRSKPLARYRKEGGQVWVSYMTTNGDLFVEKDFNVQGTISQGGTGGGSGPPIVKGGLIEQTAGGVGVSTSGTTGAVSFASGTPSVGTLPVNKGGTAVTANTTWVNTNVVMKADGVLGYDGSAVACTMNTLADGGNIRSRVTAGLDATGDVQRVVEPEYGGTGQDFSGDATGYLRIVNGTTTQRAYNDAKTDLSLNNVANVDQRDAANISSGILATARHSAHVTDNLNADGLVSGRAIGDAVQTAVLYNGDAQEARTSPATGDYTITNSNVWEQDDDTQIIKISFDYLHNSNNRGLKLSCLLRSSSGSHNAVATLSVYNNTVSGSFTSGSLPDTSGSPIVSVALSTNKLYFDSTHTSSMLGLTTASGSPGTGEVADGTLYKVTIGLHNANASETAYMSAPTVTVFGSTS
jgi:hypothetical protein